MYYNHKDTYNYNDKDKDKDDDEDKDDDNGNNIMILNAIFNKILCNIEVYHSNSSALYELWLGNLW